MWFIHFDDTKILPFYDSRIESSNCLYILESKHLMYICNCNLRILEKKLLLQSAHCETMYTRYKIQETSFIVDFQMYNFNRYKFDIVMLL